MKYKICRIHFKHVSNLQDFTFNWDARAIPVGIYLFNNKHTNNKKWNLVKVIEVIPMSLLITLNRFHNLFWWFYCWLWKRKISIEWFHLSFFYFFWSLQRVACGSAICIYLLFKGDGYYKTSNQEVVSYILWKAVAFLFLWEVVFVWIPEAATWGALKEKMLLEISQNSQRNTHVRVSFLIKLQLQLY